MRSSYATNKYGLVFKTIVIALKPVVCVEVGVLDGYSALSLGDGVRALRLMFNINSTLDCYDLWEDYPYNHGEMENVQKLLEKSELDGFVKLYKGDAFEVYKKYGDECVDLLHFDISNDGEILEKLMDTWHYKIRPGGIILFEGGSLQRDQVEWMKKYNKKPIFPVLNSNEVILNNYITLIYPDFPSVTLMFKKGNFS